jgi:hypothetical protein
MMRTLFFHTLLLLSLAACRGKSESGSVDMVCDDGIFPEIIELKGEHLLTDSLMNPNAKGMLLKKDRLVFQYEANPPLLLLRYPEMDFVTCTGIRGNGPDEFVFPSLVPASDPDLICYVYESTNQKLYTVDHQFRIEFYPFEMKGDRSYFNTHVVNAGKDDFMYVGFTAEGGNICRAVKIGDSVHTRSLHDLALKPDLRKFAPYSGGCMAVNGERNRLVYGYMFYKVILFMDLDGRMLKKMDFKQSEYDESTMYVADGLDLNVTHYWRIYGGTDHVYLMHLNCKTEGFLKTDAVSSIEQYDWEGNPVRKYNLDHLGQFVVDEKNSQLILCNPREDDPMYLYRLR